MFRLKGKKREERVVKLGEIDFGRNIGKSKSSGTVGRPAYEDQIEAGSAWDAFQQSQAQRLKEIDQLKCKTRVSFD